ncbi:MAG: hypothetical protein LBP59_19255 [Planctomycetaceae bacterium]|jgi:hypothetical protein|nr:hypothetical protein [Planctomycetaceae bacterium]
MKSNFRSETALRVEAMNILIEHLGELDTERFINSILKDQFDYTEWQRNLWKNKTIQEIHQNATAFYNKNNPKNSF